MNSSVNKRRHLWKTVWVWAVIAHERWRHMDFCEFQASLVSLLSVFQTSHSKINYLIHCSHRTVPSIVWLGVYKGGCISLLKRKQKRAAHVSNKCGLLFLKNPLFFCIKQYSIVHMRCTFFICSHSDECVGHFCILTPRGHATVNLELLIPVWDLDFSSFGCLYGLER